MTSENRTKAIMVGRHNLMPIQAKMIQKLGIEIVRQVPQVPTQPQEIQQFVTQLKSEGIEAIVIQALPVPILSQLLQETKKHGIKVLALKQETIFTGNPEEAEKIRAEKPEARAILPGNPARVIEARAITEIKEIKIVEETLITVEQV